MRASHLASIFGKVFLCASLVAIGGASAPTVTENVLHAFGGTPDGELPVAGLVSNSKTGNLFGTTSGGGKYGFGLVFELTQRSQHQTEKKLYSFTGGADGSVPLAGLIFDSSGNLFGTTSGGGKYGFGVVFELTGSSGHTAEKVLHSFKGGTSDGAVPKAGLVIDPLGNLYGTTSEGGTSGLGVVFKLDSKGHETVLHSFTGGPSDGAVPVAGLVRDTLGNLYGTTSKGGTSGLGVVFALDSKGHETVLHSFTGSDGAVPKAGLILDTLGNLYGTTSKGGTRGLGVAFELTKPGYKKEVVLHSFAGGSDGSDPEAGLAFDLKMTNLYGTTAGGGKGFGVVFELRGSGHTIEVVLFRFKGGSDGGVPLAGLIFTPHNADEPAGDRLTPPGPGGCTYACGTTVFGGHLGCNHPRGCGVVFNLVN